jgi:hypothetical protein
MVVLTSPIALDPATHAELEAMLRKGMAEYNAHTPQQVRGQKVVREGKENSALWINRRPPLTGDGAM